MSARSTPVPTGAQAQPAGNPDKALRRLRQLCIALAVVCAAALPFELGVLPTPHRTAGVPATPHPTPKIAPDRCGGPHNEVLCVKNYPRTAVVGHWERFSVRLAGVSHTWLTYELEYPDGRQDRARVRADASGYSSHTFRLSYRPRQFREVAYIGVQDSSGRLRATRRFAIQQAQ
jgi:hypothetical protein